MLIKVDDYNYVRDTSSMALINTDRSAKEEYVLKKRILTKQKEEIDRINTEINDLKVDIKDIKSMLIQILSDKN